MHEIQRLGLPDLDDDGLKNLASQFDRKPEDLYVALGCGDINIGRVVNKLIETKESDDVLGGRAGLQRCDPHRSRHRARPERAFDRHGQVLQPDSRR